MGLLDGRRRKHAHDLDVAIPLVRKLRERMDEDGFPRERLPYAPSDVDDVIEETEALRDGLLAGGNPESGQLREVQRACRWLIQALKATHPEDVSAYLDSLESTKDQRLIRSM